MIAIDIEQFIPQLHAHDSTHRHYVYSLAYPDGTIFYIGKGVGNRIDQHEREATHKRYARNHHKVNIIRKIWREGGQVLKTKLAYFSTHEDAIQYEIALIFLLPHLANATHGGEGRTWTEEHRQKVRGHAVSESTRKAVSLANSCRVFTEETRQKHRENALNRQSWLSLLPSAGRKHTEEEKAKISASNKGRRLSDEARSKISVARTGQKRTYVETEEIKRKRIETRRQNEYWHAPSTRHKMSEQRKGKSTHPQSEGAREKIRQASLQHRHTDATKQKLRQIKSQRDSAWQESIKEIRLEYWRTLRGLSQRELAHLCQISRDTVGNIERGLKTPTLKTLQKLSQALDITLEQLVIWAYEEEER